MLGTWGRWTQSQKQEWSGMLAFIWHHHRPQDVKTSCPLSSHDTACAPTCSLSAQTPPDSMLPSASSTLGPLHRSINVRVMNSLPSRAHSVYSSASHSSQWSLPVSWRKSPPWIWASRCHQTLPQSHHHCPLPSWTISLHRVSFSSSSCYCSSANHRRRSPHWQLATLPLGPST